MEESIYAPGLARDGREAREAAAAAAASRARALGAAASRAAALANAGDGAGAGARRRAVGGALPVLVDLARDDLAVDPSEAPKPYAAMVPRASYAGAGSFLAAAAAAYFAPARTAEMLVARASKSDEEDDGADSRETAPCVWFSTEDGLPLKAWMPVGALFDLLGGGALPWRLTAHFSRWPAAALGAPGAAGADTPFAAFCSTIKEAAFVRFGSAKSVLALSAAELRSLWEAADAADVAAWQRPETKLRAAEDGASVRAAPLRVYTRGGDGVEAYTRSADAAVSFGDALRRILAAGLYGSDLSSKMEAGAGGDGARPDPLGGVRVRVQGVEPPLDAPVSWLLEELAGPDGMLHVALSA